MRNPENFVTIPFHPGNSQREVHLGYANCRSVLNKSQSIHDLIVENGLDTFAIVESWLKSSGDERIMHQVTPEGYSFTHAPRPNDVKGGGVALIYKILCISQYKTVLHPETLGGLNILTVL